MKQILAFAFILLFVRSNAQTWVGPINCAGSSSTFYMRVTFSDSAAAVHDISTVTCPDNTTHTDTEEESYLKCTMELFQDANCTQPISVDPRFFEFVRDVSGSVGTQNNPAIIYNTNCSATIPGSATYAGNYRNDYTLIYQQQCIWECNGGGYYNCYPSGPGAPANYNIVINCCFSPCSLSKNLSSVMLENNPISIYICSLETAPGTTYLWNTGETTRCINTTHNGSFYCIISNSSGCTGLSDTVTITSLSTLPVNVVYFNGQRTSDINRLTWKFENTQDFASFNLERSFDRINYSSVYSTTDVSSDRYSDQTGGTAYYKLKLLNKDGKFSPSPVVVLKASETGLNQISASPSPFKDHLDIAVTTTSNAKSIIKLISMEGKTVFQTHRQLDKGVNTFTVNMPGIAAGIYVLSINTGSEILNTKVTKL